MRRRIAAITLSIVLGACSDRVATLAATQPGHPTAKPNPTRPSDRAYRLKREIEHDEDTAISARYGKTLRAGSIVYKRPAPPLSPSTATEAAAETAYRILTHSGKAGRGRAYFATRRRKRPTVA